MTLRDKFMESNIPYDEIDVEMIEILDVLNFGLQLKTKFCCVGHEVGEPISIMFDSKVTDEEIYMILSVVDSNVGTSGVKGTKLFKWARLLYQPHFKQPYYPRTNWILEIQEQGDRIKQLNKVTDGLKSLYDYDKSKVG